MNRQPRRGFTLVELLVVISIIGVLMALLLPAVQAAREAGRRAECMNNQHQLSLAMLSYESAHKHFPGYVDMAGKLGPGSVAPGAPYPGSWVIPLLPHIGRNDLYELWREPRVGRPGGASYVEVLVCPSHSPSASGPQDTPLSYAVNCGRWDQDEGDGTAVPPRPADFRHNGVFHRHLPGFTVSGHGPEVQVSLDYIGRHDGAACTLLLAENNFERHNIQEYYWTGYVAQYAETDLGFVWMPPGYQVSINYPPDPSIAGNRWAYARPSSNHPGGVVVSFCDGSQQFLNESIDYRVLIHLMTPDSEEAEQTAAAQGYAIFGTLPDYKPVLSEGDY